MHPGLGAQPAVCVLAPELHGGALDARHLARRHLDQVRTEAPLLAPAQVHAQQHLRPVLGFGAAGSRLDVEKGVGFVLLALEHAAELKLREALRHLRQFLLDVVQGVRVVVRGSQIGEVGQVGEHRAQVFEPVDHHL